MTSRAVFVDTVALVALAVESDAWHARAREIESQLTAERAPLVTSEWILTEFLNAAARNASLRTAAGAIVRRL